MSKFEQSGTIGRGPGEGTFHAPEQFSLEQVFRNGAAILADEGSIGAKAVLMDRTSCEFFTSAAFSGDQDRCLTGSDTLDQMMHRKDVWMLTDDRDWFEGCL